MAAPHHLPELVSYPCCRSVPFAELPPFLNFRKCPIFTDIYEKYPDADALTEKFMTVFEDEVFSSLEFSKNWVPPNLQSDAQEIRVKSDDTKFLADLVDWLNKYPIENPEDTTVFLNC